MADEHLELWLPAVPQVEISTHAVLIRYPEGEASIDCPHAIVEIDGQNVDNLRDLVRVARIQEPLLSASQERVRELSGMFARLGRYCGANIPADCESDGKFIGASYQRITEHIDEVCERAAAVEAKLAEVERQLEDIRIAGEPELARCIDAINEVFYSCGTGEEQRHSGPTIDDRCRYIKSHLAEVKREWDEARSDMIEWFRAYAGIEGGICFVAVIEDGKPAVRQPKKDEFYAQRDGAVWKELYDWSAGWPDCEKPILRRVEIPRSSPDAGSGDARIAETKSGDATHPGPAAPELRGPGWVCSACGTVNLDLRVRCRNCWSYKESQPEAQHSGERYTIVEQPTAVLRYVVQETETKEWFGHFTSKHRSADYLAFLNGTHPGQEQLAEVTAERDRLITGRDAMLAAALSMGDYERDHRAILALRANTGIELKWGDSPKEEFGQTWDAMCGDRCESAPDPADAILALAEQQEKGAK